MIFAKTHSASVGDHLERLLKDQDILLPARRLADDGLKAWRQVIECGYEGLVGKDPASPYKGGRTLAWLKVKIPNYREGERGWEARETRYQSPNA